MRIVKVEQKSPEWWALKVGKISGTRFGEVISGRKNSLVYELANEIIDDYIEVDSFESEAMQYGNENEPLAIDLYEAKSGIKFERGDVILSDFSDNHIASPDGYNIDLGIIVEVKCTMNGALHIQRKHEGAETKHLAQIKNYFAISDDVKEVHFVSYCGYKPLHPIFVTVYKRDQFETEVKKGRDLLASIDEKVKAIVNDYTF